MGSLAGVSILLYLIYIITMKYSNDIEKYVKSFLKMNISNI